MKRNPGYDPKEITKLQQKIADSGKSFIVIDSDNENDEYYHVNFVGAHEGVPVIFDAVVYTLRLSHESELFAIAEEKAESEFPEFKALKDQADSGASSNIPDALEEKVGLFMADMIMELQEEGEVKVSEHADLDLEAEYGIGLDVGLNVERISEQIIEKFIADFNSDTLTLDESMVSFEMREEGEED